jgi:tetratricopeptide (TPR) repeat protein
LTLAAVAWLWCAAPAHAGEPSSPPPSAPAAPRPPDAEDSAAARYDIALAYGAKGDFAKAADSLRVAVKLQPDYPQAWAHLVDALARSKRDVDAYDAATEAREKCPRCAPGTDFTRSIRPFVLYLHDKAATFFQQGKLDLAETGEVAVVKVAPDFADAYYNLGKIAAAKGKTDLAEAFYRRALDRYRPEESQLAADTKNNLAFLLLGRGGADLEAILLIRDAIAVRGERPAYLDTLGRACDATDDRACARYAYSKLLRVGGSALPADVAAHARARLARLDSATH